MVSVTAIVCEGQYIGIDFSGHAGDALHPVAAQGLVCSAVSALALNMANSVEHFTEDPFEADIDEVKGDFHFRFTAGISPSSKLLMDSLILGLQDIADSYGEPYIRICFKESP